MIWSLAVWLIDMKGVDLVVCIFSLLAFHVNGALVLCDYSQILIDYRTRRPAIQAVKANSDCHPDVLALALLLCLFYHVARSP